MIVKEEYFNKDTHSLITEYNHDNKKIDNDKLYLWLLQLGRCMYSGEIIPFDQLKECEIDHIVPRSYIKDDSFENRVLVKKLENQYKTDTLSISPLIKEKMASFWNFLAKHKFIGSKKLTNLTRGEYSESEKVGFINRQLVETSQIIKEVRDILSKRYPSATIQGIRAGLTSNFRYKYSYEGKAGFFKIRQLNNLHHAKDAYLTAVLGQFTTVACPLWGQDKLNRAYNYYIANNEQSKDDVATLVNKRYGLILDLMQYGDLDKFELSEDGEYLWDNQRYMNIFKMMEKNTCLIVKKKLYYANSDFYKQTIYSPLTGKNLLPLKSKKGEDMPSNIYGGYSEEHPAYFLIVKYDKVNKKKTETKYALSRIPLLTEMQNLKDNSVIDNYIKTKFGDTAVIIRKIFNNQLINFDGHLCYVTGEGEINNAVELFVDPKFEKLLYMIEKDSIRIIKDKQTTSQQIKDEAISQQIKEFIIHYNYKIRKHMPLFANFADKLDNILAEFYNDMTIESKIKLVKEMLVVSKSGAGRFDLDKQLGGGTFGRLSKTIYPDKVE
ncbi:MAG: type II CRISPR RNA-guided endonuclease Cas9, partial [Clostridia bacterium]